MIDKIVDVKNMSVKFGDFWAVKNVSFAVAPGQIFGFLGANGAGKTTTIRVLCGLLPATSGRVIIDGISFTPGNENKIKEKVGYMSQKFTLYNDLSVKENFDFAAALHQMDNKLYLERRKQLLEFVGFDGDIRVVVKNIPGGIKQQIALCVALLHQPKIVFLDEPTAGVAPHARFRFWKLIRELANEGMTVFVTTHYMDEAENCEQIALMRAGEIIATASPDELKQKTFGNTLFSVKPKKDKPMRPTPDVIDLWQPYGARFHVKFKDGVDVASWLRKLKRDWEIQQIPPSLEDVFIRLVEGKNR